jgi:hypothetical protein
VTDVEAKSGQAYAATALDHPAANRSPALDEVRRLLFPNLSPEEGWARIDRAFSGAEDPKKVRAIEELAATTRESLGSDPAAVLLARLQELKIDLDAD